MRRVLSSKDEREIVLAGVVTSSAALSTDIPVSWQDGFSLYWYRESKNLRLCNAIII